MCNVQIIELFFSGQSSILEQHSLVRSLHFHAEWRAVYWNVKYDIPSMCCCVETDEISSRTAIFFSSFRWFLRILLIAN